MNKRERRGRTHEHPSGLSLTVVVIDGAAYVEWALPSTVDSERARARWNRYQQKQGARRDGVGARWPSEAAATKGVKDWLAREAARDT